VGDRKRNKKWDEFFPQSLNSEKFIGATIKDLKVGGVVLFFK
jgi:hypothetical protein